MPAIGEAGGCADHPGGGGLCKMAVATTLASTGARCWLETETGGTATPSFARFSYPSGGALKGLGPGGAAFEGKAGKAPLGGGAFEGTGGGASAG